MAEGGWYTAVRFFLKVGVDASITVSLFPTPSEDVASEDSSGIVDISIISASISLS